MSHPGVGEYHGCPFKTFDADNLKAAVRAESGGAISSNDADFIVDLCKKQHYQIACKKFFELTHPARAASVAPSKDGNADMPFAHPNLYYRNSRFALGDDTVKSEDKAKCEDCPSNSGSSSSNNSNNNASASVPVAKEKVEEEEEMDE